MLVSCAEDQGARIHCGISFAEAAAHYLNCEFPASFPLSLGNLAAYYSATSPASITTTPTPTPTPTPTTTTTTATATYHYTTAVVTNIPRLPVLPVQYYLIATSTLILILTPFVERCFILIGQLVFRNTASRRYVCLILVHPHFDLRLIPDVSDVDCSDPWFFFRSVSLFVQRGSSGSSILTGRWPDSLIGYAMNI